MRIRKAILYILLVLAALCSVAACHSANPDEKGENKYMSITPQQAKDIMDSDSDAVILDVRTKEEYEKGHIDGAVLIPDYEIGERAETELTDKDRTILVYCRVGQRSEAAAKELVSMGYKNVKDFGGLVDWPYEIKKNNQ